MNEYVCARAGASFLCVAAMLQRPTAGHIIILFNAAGFVWQRQTVLGAAGVVGMLSSE